LVGAELAGLAAKHVQKVADAAKRLEDEKETLLAKGLNPYVEFRKKELESEARGRYYNYIYGCMYVCMCVCMYVCMYVYIYICIYICIYMLLSFNLIILLHMSSNLIHYLLFREHRMREAVVRNKKELGEKMEKEVEFTKKAEHAVALSRGEQPYVICI
jgi:hypothetical protein